MIGADCPQWVDLSPRRSALGNVKIGKKWTALLDEAALNVGGYCISVGLLLVSLLANDAIADERSSPLPKCVPMPKSIHIEPPDMDWARGRAPHQGSVEVEFSVARDGSVSAPAIVRSDDAWFNDAVLAAMVKWRYSKVSAPCRGRAVVTFKVTG